MSDTQDVLCVRCGDKVFSIQPSRMSNGAKTPADLYPKVACARCARDVANVTVPDLEKVPNESYQDHLVRLNAAKDEMRKSLPANFGRNPKVG